MKQFVIFLFVLVLLVPLVPFLMKSTIEPLDTVDPYKSFKSSEVVYNDSIIAAEDGLFSLGDEFGHWTNTTQKDGVAWGSYLSPATLELQFDSDDSSLAAFDYALYGKISPSSIYRYDLDIYNFTSSSWVEFDEIDQTTYTWFNGSVSSSDFWNSTGGIRLRLDSGESSSNDLFWDYAELRFYVSGDELSYYVTPEQPTEEDPVTFTVITQPDDNISTAYFDAIISPSDYTDQIYYFTEEPSYVFTYDFTSLPDGYYLFIWYLKNSTGLKYVFYVPLSITATDIDITPITFFGVGEDFTQMQISFEINKECNYSIYEGSALVPESETHNGTVYVGWSNIAWDKLSTTDSTVQFGIKFEHQTLWTWINGSYSIAQTTFYVEFFGHDGPSDASTVTVTGHITKLGSYTVYVDDVSWDSGTVSELDFEIEFTKAESAEGAWHEWGIKFTNGSQTCWANGTYYRWNYSPDRAERGGAAVAEARSALQVASWTLIGVAAIIIYILVQGRKEGNL